MSAFPIPRRIHSMVIKLRHLVDMRVHRMMCVEQGEIIVHQRFVILTSAFGAKDISHPCPGAGEGERSADFDQGETVLRCLWGSILIQILHQKLEFMIGDLNIVKLGEIIRLLVAFSGGTSVVERFVEDVGFAC